MVKWIALSTIFFMGFPSLAWGMAPSKAHLAGGAQSAVLLDVTSGRVLVEKMAHKKSPIASLTKIMTAIVAIEQGKLDENVVIGPHAVGVEGSSIYLKKGEKIPLRTLLYGLMLRSGNDAATAIAEHIGGSVEGFVYLMNQKAEMLGLEQTHFMNPHGLDDKEHYSSAFDLARLTAYSLKNPAFREIVKTEVKKVPWPEEEWSRTFHNKNKLLRLYEWADGVKTGYTKKAKRTLVTSATKEGQQLVAVTLNDGNDWDDHMSLFDYGFAQYSLTPVLSAGQEVSVQAKNGKDNLRIVSASTFQYPLTVEERTQLQIEPVLTRPLKHVEKEGITVGYARLFLNHKEIGSVLLKTQRVKSSFLSQCKKVFFHTLRQVVQGR